jgi:predicted GNAT family acetyltransferase
MTYRRRPELIEINHTEVFKSFEGQGVGGALARQSLDRVRGEGLAVLPFCPFLAGWIGKHEAYLDLVPEGSRARFGLA